MNKSNYCIVKCRDVLESIKNGSVMRRGVHIMPFMKRSTLKLLSQKDDLLARNMYYPDTPRQHLTEYKWRTWLTTASRLVRLYVHVKLFLWIFWFGFKLRVDVRFPIAIVCNVLHHGLFLSYYFSAEKNSPAKLNWPADGKQNPADVRSLSRGNFLQVINFHMITIQDCT